MSVAELLENNKAYVAAKTADQQAEDYIHAKTAIITCMDPRVNIEAALQLSPYRGGKSAAIIRNAAGRFVPSADARPLVIIQELANVEEIMVVHHTDCGALKSAGLGPAEVLDLKKTVATGTGPWAEGAYDEAVRLDILKDIKGFEMLHKGESLDRVLVRSVHDDVKRVRESPLVRQHVRVSGWIYELETARIVSVQDFATERNVAV